MKIRKCDHCGKEIVPQTYKNMFRTETRIDYVSASLLHKEHGDSIEINYDICNDCYRELRKWLNDEEAE